MWFYAANETNQRYLRPMMLLRNCLLLVAIQPSSTSSMKKSKYLLLLLSLSVGCAFHASAQATWNGGGGASNTNWNNGANWVGGVQPPTGSSLLFTGSTGLNSNNNTANSSFTYNTITFDSAAGAFVITGNPLKLGSTNTIVDNSTAVETINDNITSSSTTAARSISVGAGGNLVLGGVISGAFGTSTAGLTKTGAGTLTLSGANTYSTPTSVNAGTLAGKGSVSGAVILAGGATIAPGLGTGDTTNKFTAGSLTWNSASGTGGLSFTLDGASTNSTNLTLTGAFTQGTGSGFDINLADNGQILGAGTYDLINFGSTNFTDVSQFNLISTLDLAPGLTGSLVLTGNQLDFNVVASEVPEPGAWALMLGGLGALVFLQRRRSNA